MRRFATRFRNRRIRNAGAGHAAGRGRTQQFGSGRTAPPEWAANVGSWPAHNLDLANTRANLHTEIDGRNVSTLKKRWTVKLPYAGSFGAFTSNPIVLDGIV